MSSNALVGAAGVHFVVGELSRRGWIALQQSGTQKE